MVQLLLVHRLDITTRFARVTEFTEKVLLSIAAETAAMESQSAAEAAISDQRA